MIYNMLTWTLGSSTSSPSLFDDNLWQKNEIRVTPGDLAARHLGHMLVNTKLKVAFCPIEKVASSQFRQVHKYVICGFMFWMQYY